MAAFSPLTVVKRPEVDFGDTRKMETQNHSTAQFSLIIVLCSLQPVNARSPLNIVQGDKSFAADDNYHNLE